MNIHKNIVASYITKVLILFFIYFSTAKLGLSLDAVSGFATLFWLPTGISLASLFLFGYSLWPGIALGAFFVNLLSGAPLYTAIGIAIGNTLEAILGMYVLKYHIEIKPSLHKIKYVLGLIVYAAVLSTMVSATIGVASLCVGGVVSISAFIPTWVAWWLGDMISNLTIAPLLLVWGSKPYISIHATQIREVTLLFIVIVIIGLLVFLGLYDDKIKNYPLTYLVFPPIIWIALRFSQRETITATFFLSLFAVIGTAFGYGPFAHERLNESLIHLQSFMVILASTSMILGAAIMEKNELEKKKDEFMSVASHELKTPLTSIKAFTQILQNRFRKQKDTRSLQYLERMNTQLNNVIRLINELLDVTRIQTKNLVLEKEKFNIDTLLHEIMHDLSDTYQSRRIIKEGKIRVVINADRNRISQVLINLLSNAIKYSPSSTKVVIQVIKGLKDITIKVKDQGVGIPKDKQEKVFDRFYQVERKGVGDRSLGLGLFIASEIIKAHKGKIWVESEKGKGSTFYITIPLK